MCLDITKLLTNFRPILLNVFGRSKKSSGLTFNNVDKLHVPYKIAKPY